MNNVHVKFESDRTKTVVCIVPTRRRVTDRRTYRQTHGLTQAHTKGRITISPRTLLRGDNKHKYTDRSTHFLFRLEIITECECLHYKKWFDWTSRVTWPLKRDVYTSINGHFSTSCWHYPVTVANVIQKTISYRKHRGFKKRLKMISVIIRIKCLILSVYWSINIIWRVTNYV